MWSRGSCRRGPPVGELSGTELEIRHATPADDRAVLALLGRALGWAGDERFEDFFAWKHRQSPFGSSPAWVGVMEGAVVGFRAFLRWELEDGEARLRAVRAVDTATDPSRQRLGIFSRLTRHALAELEADGVAFVFNTPNTQSRPGYLKMGWRDVGRVPLAARPRAVRNLPALAGARGGAQRWSEPTTAGVPAGEVLADAENLEALLESQPQATGLRTAKTVEFLRWRYGFAPLDYRAMYAGRSPADGFALFRVRRRAKAIEAAVADVLVPGGRRRLAAAALRRIARSQGVDYAVAVNTPGAAGAGFLRVPGQGPRLTWKGLAHPVMPPLASWDLRLADVELF